MRIWGFSPFVGSEVAQFSRRYFFSGSVLAFVILSSYAWAGFPYDNLCDVVNNPKTGANRTYEDFQSYSKEIEDLQIVVVEQNEYVRFCGQSWKFFKGLPFPAVSSKQPDGYEWMGESQTILTDIFGWTSVFFLIAFIVLFFGTAILKYLRSWFFGVYVPSGQKQEIDFSANNGKIFVQF